MSVFHHLEFPGTVLKEFKRVLTQGGRIIIFEPAVSLLGSLIYGVFHHEPTILMKKIKWPTSVGTRFIKAGQITTGYLLQTNADAVLYQASREAVISLLTRAFGEKGVLTTQDVERIKNALPTLIPIPDTKTIAEAKIKQLKGLVEEIGAKTLELTRQKMVQEGAFTKRAREQELNDLLYGD